MAIYEMRGIKIIELYGDVNVTPTTTNGVASLSFQYGMHVNTKLVFKDEDEVDNIIKKLETLKQ